jgi:hypothetical protein
MKRLSSVARMDLSSSWLFLYYCTADLNTDDDGLVSVMKFVGYQYQKQRSREIIALQEAENDCDQTE